MPENRFGWCECTTCENEVVSLAKYDPVFSNDENTKKNQHKPKEIFAPPTRQWWALCVPKP